MGRYLRQHRIELVHAFDTPGNLFAVPVARAFRVPVVLSSQRAFRGLSRTIDRHFLRILDRLADAVVVNCRELAKHLVAEEHEPYGQIRLCYNGIDTRNFNPENRARAEALRDASLVIGTVCALRPEKGLTTLAEAFAQIARDTPGIRLVIVGSGSMLAKLESMRAAFGLQDRWILVPSVSEVVPWLRSIDIFVLPSLSEAFSNSLMEAMACGCAVVASRVGGNAELVEDGETGMLFRPADAGSLALVLSKLIDQPAVRLRIAAAGTQRILSRFSREKAAATMAAIYESFFDA
jgi:glycosyltransferase involved in cell wall biosynthesis